MEQADLENPVNQSARSPGKLWKAKANPKKRSRKKTRALDDDDDDDCFEAASLATSPGPGAAAARAMDDGTERQRGTLSSASSSSRSGHSLSPAPPKAHVEGTPTGFARVPSGGAQAGPRPGGLLDNMRQRGTGPAAALTASPALAPGTKALAPGVVPAILRSFVGSAPSTSSASSTPPPGGSSSHALSTGSNCSAASAPSASPTEKEKAASATQSSPKSLNRCFDFSLSPLLSRAAEKADLSPAPRKRSREEAPANAAVSPAPAVAAPPAPAAPAVAAPPVQAVAQAAATSKALPGKVRKISGKEAGLPASPARARKDQPRSSLALKLSPLQRRLSASPKPRKEPRSAVRFSIRPPVPQFPPAELEPWQLVRQIKLPPKSEEDNYEISEKGSDSEAEEPDRSEKHTPAWSANYLQLLEAQADIDADTIFGCRVPQCDLDVIFLDSDYKKYATEKPRRKRGSSARWHRDRLSRAEIRLYKQKMGQKRRWSKTK